MRREEKRRVLTYTRSLNFTHIEKRRQESYPVTERDADVEV